MFLSSVLRTLAESDILKWISPSGSGHTYTTYTPLPRVRSGAYAVDCNFTEGRLEVQGVLLKHGKAVDKTDPSSLEGIHTTLEFGNSGRLSRSERTKTRQTPTYCDPHYQDS